MTGTTSGYAAFSAEQPLGPFDFELRELRADDVKIDIKYCGLCHSDIHMARNEVGNAIYPMVPGHEIAGIVSAVGSGVTKHKVGDRVGVGCFVGRCNECDACLRDMEPYCLKRTPTYNKPLPDGSITRGGYAQRIVVPEHFACKIPESIPLEKAAPLLCAGITTYSALKYYGFDQPGKKIGVHGLGGLGHMAVQLIKAFGAEPIVLSHSANKQDDAYKLGASDFVLFGSEQEKEYFEKLDGIIDTVSGCKSMTRLLEFVKFGCTVCPIAVPPAGFSYEVPPSILFRRKQIGGSLVGGLKETQEMLDFCAEKGIVPWIEMIKMADINSGFDRVCKSDVKYRFVIDVAGSYPQ